MPKVPAHQHKLERVAQALAESIKRRVELYVKWGTLPDGRPMFTVAPTDREELDRWLNPALQKEKEQAIFQRGGAEEVQEYHRRMSELFDKWLEGRLGGKT